MSIKHLLFAFVALFSGTGNVFSQQEEIARYTTPEFDAAIFPASSPDIFSGRGRFTPTKEEVNQAELALKQHLKELNSDRMNQYDTPVIDKNLKRYKRQYFGYLDANGNKILYINFFWRNEKEENKLWLKEKIQVLDGGSYYWNIKYKIESGELFDLTVNGAG